MKVDKTEIKNYIKDSAKKLAFTPNGFAQIMSYAKNTYNLPEAISSDILNDRIKVEHQPEYVLFDIVEGINKVLSNSKKETGYFFTDSEIKAYSKHLYEKEKISFPIKVPCFQISSDQWIGYSDINFLIELRKAQMINYNTNAQRVMEKKIKNGVASYRIAINKEAINEISESLNSNNFIPNTITLNIPDDTETDFVYNEKEKCLIIKKVPYFDILDGYHRYVAACNIKDKDDSFNYPIELRLVFFDEAKAKSFIFQEDQKTPMKRLDSLSMNMRNEAVQVCEKLTGDVSLDKYYSGKISRNEGQISFSQLVDIVEYFYFRKQRKERNYSDSKAIRETERRLVKCFNDVLDKNEWLLDDNEWVFSWYQLVCIVFGEYNTLNRYQFFVKDAEKVKEIRRDKGYKIGKPTLDALESVMLNSK